MNEEKTIIPSNILNEIENIVIDISKKQLKDFTDENRVLSVYSEDPKMQPRECAEKCNKQFGLNKIGDNIITTFRKCKLSIIHERERLFATSEQLSLEVLKCICGNQMYIEDIDQISKQFDQHIQLRRITLIYLFSISEQLKHSYCYAYMLKMNKDFAGECLDAILTFVKNEYFFKTKVEKNKTIEEYESELFRIEASLNRANNILVRLQDEFEDRLEESRIEAQENLISMLNSPKYGYILDLLVEAQQGFKQLRAQKVDVPFAINTTPTLVRKLLQFVEDCGITQILKVGEQIDAKLSDIEGYTFEGTPFIDENETKKMIVTSSGWEIKEKGIVISNPVLKELEMLV